jgi:type 1 glutamine amidotransferase/regulation of enolase protein 1 (concanavalin A-like superfamily)
MRRVLTLALAGAAGLIGSLGGPGIAAAQDAPKVLVFSKTAGFRHASIPSGIAAIRQLGADHGFAVDATEDAAQFTSARLAQYDAVVWLSTTGDVLNAAQEAAFEAYIKQGGGYVGVHAAADTEYGWSWYGGLVGAYFQSHPANQTARVRVTDRAHPSTRDLPAEWTRFDEWYNYAASPRQRVHVLAELDESSYSPGSGAMGADHPIAWCHGYDGGRAWYTGMGHTNESYAEKEFLQHVLGGIRYAAGIETADCGEPAPPPDACALTGSDEFDGQALDTTLWSSRVRENPAAYEVRDGALRITTQVGDLWSAGGDAKNLLLQPAPSGDWQVTTRVTIDATGGSEQAGLLLYAGDDNYIKLNHIGRNGAKWFEFIVETGGSPRFDSALDRTANLPAGFPTTMQLRMTSEGGQIRGAYSTDDGGTWTTVGRPVGAGVLANPRIGVFAQTNEAQYVTDAAFDWFRVAGGGAGGPDDEFDGDALGCPWSTIVRENPDRYEVSGGALRITTANGDLYGPGGNVENIVLQRAPGGTWEATTKLTLDATGGGQQGGVTLYSGDDDYAKVAHVAKNGQKWFEFLVETGGKPRFDQALDRTPNLAAGFPTTFQVKLSYDDGTLTAAYSTDGEAWTPVGRPATVSSFPAPKVGVFAQTNDASFVTEAAFDWFHLDGATGQDTTPPTVRAQVDGLPTSDGRYLNATVAIAASDFGSGVDTVEYAIDDGGWQPYAGPFELNAGAHTVRHRATDRAGNASSEGTTRVTVVGDLGCAPVAPAGAGYVPIFDGTVGSLDGWRMAGAGGFDANADCTIDAWGGMGLLWYAAQELDSAYTVRAEWKIYADDDNSGMFIGFPDPGDDPWLPVSQGYEIQIDPTDEPVRTTGAVYSFQAPDETARAAALRPYGEWNVMEVSVDGTKITIRLNGTVINQYTSPHPERSPMTGFVGIQNDGAGRDVTYRSVQLRDDGPPPADTTAPVVEASLAGTGPVTVRLDAADDGSGVASVEYTLDSGAWTAYNGPFVVSAPGAHRVAYRATDAAGNASEPRTVEFTIAQPAGSPLGSPPAGGGNQPPSLGVEPATYRLSGAVSRVTKGRFGRSGLRLGLSSSAAASGTARVLVSEREARRLGLGRRVLASRAVRFTRAGSQTLRLKPGRALARRLGRARGAVPMTLEIRLRDAGGKATTITRRITLG